MKMYKFVVFISPCVFFENLVHYSSAYSELIQMLGDTGIRKAKGCMIANRCHKKAGDTVCTKVNFLPSYQRAKMNSVKSLGK